MEESGCSNVQSSHGEYIAMTKVTRGTETSKYPQEEKETSISKVAASEMERAQTRFTWGCGSPQSRIFYSRTRLESRTEGGKSPVREIEEKRGDTRVMPGT